MKKSHFPESFTNKRKIEVELDLSNYATKINKFYRCLYITIC